MSGTRRFLNTLGILILMGITAVVSILAYITIVGGSGAPSQDISQVAPTLDLSTPTPNPLEAEVAALSTQVADLQATNEALSAAQATAAGASDAAAQATAIIAGATGTAAAMQPTAVPPTATPEPAAAVLYRIVSDESLVTFSIFERLRGIDTTVLGTTDQVGGDILVDFGAPANSRVGEIVINARSLATDNNFRNGALRTEILESANDAYEFITFTPTSIEGLPEALAVGEELTFQIVGDLKIRDIVQSVTFEVTATAVSEERLEGVATATVTRTQFNLTIPNVPGVTDVADDVPLEIRFVAMRVEA